MAGAPADRAERKGRGFQRASVLLSERIRKAGETRGFAVARLLTHWAEIVGSETAALCRPVKVGYGREGFGATLTLLVPGAVAPLVQMQAETIREKVNACYGYNAISRVRITQSAPEGAPGLAEAQAPFRPKDPDPAQAEAASRAACGVTDPGLREALEALGRNVLSKH